MVFRLTLILIWLGNALSYNGTLNQYNTWNLFTYTTVLSELADLPSEVSLISNNRNSCTQGTLGYL